MTWFVGNLDNLVIEDSAPITYINRFQCIYNTRIQLFYDIIQVARNRGDIVTFFEFMQDFVGDDTPLGELAQYINNDVNFPKSVSDTRLTLLYFHDISIEKNIAVSTVKRAIDLFSQFTTYNQSAVKA